MHFKKLILGTLFSAVSAVGFAQTSVPLELIWKVQANDAASTYILSTGDATRGMTLNPSSATGGSLLVASRAGGVNYVYRLEPSSGLLKEPSVLPNSGYMTTSTTFAVNKVVATDDGVIYVASLGNTGSSSELHFRVYRHANESSEATLAYDVRTDSFSGNGGPGINARLGDDIDVIGTGNNTKILVAGTAGIIYQLTTTDGGMTFTGQQITCSPAVAGNPNIAWDRSTPNRFFFRDATPNQSRAYDISGTTATGASGPGNELPNGTVADKYGPIAIGPVNGVQSLLLGIGASAAGSPVKEVRIYQISDLTATYFGLGSEYTPGGVRANGNAAGDVYLDSANNTAYFLYTNNSITKFRIPGASVGQWNNY